MASHAVCPGGDSAFATPRRTLEVDIRQAIADGGFELHYQPVIDSGTSEIVGCEALLRWKHPVRGMISLDSNQTIDTPWLDRHAR